MTAPRIFKAISFDEELLLLWREKWHAQIHSSFDGAVNLLDEEENLIILLSRYRSNGPNRIILDVPYNFSFRENGFSEKKLFLKSEKSIHSADYELIIDLRSSFPWKKSYSQIFPRISRASLLNKLKKTLQFLLKNSKEDDYLIKTCIAQLLDTESSPLGQGDFLQKRLIMLCKELISDIRTKKKSDIKKKLESLFGLGIGLTPSGDDILLGIISTLQFFRNNFFSHEKRISCDLKLKGYEGKLLDWFGEFIKEKELRTTFISAKQLKWASFGRIPEDILSFLESFVNENDQDLEENAIRIISTGSTSGIETMLGITIGLYMMLL